MTADIFTACHSEQANKDGTFTIDRAFYSLVIPGPLPRKLHKINVAIRIIFDEDEAGDHVLTLKTTDNHDRPPWHWGFGIGVGIAGRFRNEQTVNSKSLCQNWWIAAYGYFYPCKPDTCAFKSDSVRDFC